MPQQNGQRLSGEFRLRQVIRFLAVMIPLAIAGNIIYIILSSRQGMLAGLADFRAGYLILAILMVFIPWLTHSARIILWGRVFGHRFRFIEALKTAIGAEVGSAVTPTSVGGGYFKLGFMVGYGFNPANATLVMILGTIEDALFFAFALPLAATQTRAWNNPYLHTAVGNIVSDWPLLIAAALAAVLIYFGVRRFKVIREPLGVSSRRKGFVARFSGSIRRYADELPAAMKFAAQNGKGTFLICAALAGVGWCCRYGAISALAWGLGYPINPLLLFLLQWIIFSTMTAIPTPGAVGGAEITFSVIHQGIFPSSILPLLMGAWRFLTYYLLAMTGAIILAFSGIVFDGRPKGIENVNFEEQKA